mgnify:CR=1 FL=1|jgi:Nitrous oxide reductase
MKKWVLTLCAVLAVVMVTAACGGSGEAGGKTNQDTNVSTGGKAEGEESSAGGSVKEFTIDATNFEFDLKEIKVKQGDTVKITLKNSQGNHAVKFEGYDEEVQGGKTISFVADKTGEFQYVCSIFCGAGHADMTGKLIVEA